MELFCCLKSLDYGQSVEELEKAELEIIKEGSSLRRSPNLKKSVKGCRHIYKLCLQIEDGVLIGQLRRSVESKYLIILAKDFYISDLLLRYIHQQVGHDGCNHVIQTARKVLDY